MKKVIYSCLALALSASIFSSSASAAVNYVDPAKTTAELTSGIFGVTTLTMFVDAKFSYDGKKAKVVNKEGDHSKKVWAGTMSISGNTLGENIDSEYGSAEAYYKLKAETGVQISGVGWVWDTYNLKVSQSASKDGWTASWATGF